MASNLTLKAASAYALKYEYTHDGSGLGAATVSLAQMITDLQTVGGPGPLLALLQAQDTTSPGGDAAWAALPTSAQLSVYANVVSTSTAGGGAAAAFTTAGGVHVLGVSNAAATTIVVEVEVRLHHTFDR